MKDIALDLDSATGWLAVIVDGTDVRPSRHIEGAVREWFDLQLAHPSADHRLTRAARDFIRHARKANGHMPLGVYSERIR